MLISKQSYVVCLQLPIIQHGPNTVPDSVFIIKYLQRTYPNVGTELSQEDEAKAIVIQHFVDKHLVPGLGWNRWIHHKAHTSPWLVSACLIHHGSC